ncbi:hypothetical protein [Pseudomonas hunanensis]|uniref:hypothetical protein n=1 Tax=Pseudomonas hunanensis TaxID=1247546 RepID=UPI0037F6FDDB
MSLDFKFDHIAFNIGADDHLPASLQTLLGVQSGPRPPFPFPGQWLYQDEHALAHLLQCDGLEATRFSHLALSTCQPAAVVMKQVKASELPHQVAIMPEQRTCQIFISLTDEFILELDCPLGEDPIDFTHDYQHNSQAPV